MPEWVMQFLEVILAALTGAGVYTARERFGRRNGSGNGHAPVTLDPRWKENVDRDIGGLMSTVAAHDSLLHALDVKHETLRSRLEERG